MAIYEKTDVLAPNISSQDSYNRDSLLPKPTGKYWTTGGSKGSDTKKEKDAETEAERRRQEEAKRKAEAEAKAKAEAAKAAEAKTAADSKAQSAKPEGLKPQEEASKSADANVNKPSESKSQPSEMDAGRGNKSGFGYDQTGTKYNAEKAATERDNSASKLASSSVDPYGNSLYNRSFARQTDQQRMRGQTAGTSVEASELRQAGQANLRSDVDLLNRAHGIGPEKGAWNENALTKDRNNNELAKVLQEKTGIKMESTGGLGQYSDRDLAKMLSTPEAKQYMNSIKSGEFTPEKRQEYSVKDQLSQGLQATKERLASNQSDFSRDLARYESTTKDTTKGPRLDTRSNSNIVRSQPDPLQSIGSNIRVKNERAAEYGGSDPLEPTTRGLNKPGIYDSNLGQAGSLAYSKVGNVPTNKPATSVGELNTRTAALEQDKIGNERAAALAQAQKSTGRTLGGKPYQQGVTMPNGEFLANAPKKPKIGVETDDQRIARREKEVGVGRFAGSMETRRSPSQSLSYFDDKSRGKRI